MSSTNEFNFHASWALSVAAVLVIVSGLVAGLTIGIMGVDQLELKILEENSDCPKQKHKYQRVQKMLQRHHLILVALLIINTICQETLPLFLNRVFPEWATIVFAVTFVLLFGEIIPQALCSGQLRIPIVSLFAPFVVCLTFLVWPLAWPIAKLLDKVVGHHNDTYYGRADLKTVVRLHEKSARLEEIATRQRSSLAASENAMVETDGLLADEVIVIEGALDMAKKGVEEIMVPFASVYALEENQLVDLELRRAIVSVGHSRIPVYRSVKENVIGMLYVKSLVADPPRLRKDAAGSLVPPHYLVRDYMDRNRCPKFVQPTHKLYDLMNDLQTGRHLALVTSDPAWHVKRWETVQEAGDGAAVPADKHIMGIVTIEDIFEELIQEEIYDEFDRNEPQSVSNNAASLTAIVKAMKLATDVDEARVSRCNSNDGRDASTSPKKTLSVIKVTNPKAHMNGNNQEVTVTFNV